VQKQINKEELSSLVSNGDTLLVGGFGLSGSPLTLIDKLATINKRDLTIVSNNLGEANTGLGKLLFTNSLRKIIGSYFTSNPDVIEISHKKNIEVELIPQGTMAEAIRCGGAGIPAFYTQTAVGTQLAKDKEVRDFDGKSYLLEKAITGDLALIKALKADTYGNLIYDHTARNFNPIMATAANIVIAEVDEIVDIGELKPDEIVTPHIYVDYIVINDYEKVGGKYIEPVR